MLGFPGAPLRTLLSTCIRQRENKHRQAEKGLYSQTSFTIYDRYYISYLKLIFKQGKLWQMTVECATRRGILLIGNFIPKFIIDCKWNIHGSWGKTPSKRKQHRRKNYQKVSQRTLHLLYGVNSVRIGWLFRHDFLWFTLNQICKGKDMYNQDRLI